MEYIDLIGANMSDGEEIPNDIPKDEIYFKMKNLQYVEIMRGNTTIGRIFSPSGSSNNCKNSVQICGMSDAFDFWGCVLDGYKDIQLLFDGKKLGGGKEVEYGMTSNGCDKCFTTPCQCEVKTLDIEGEGSPNPFVVKREFMLKDRIKYKKATVVQLYK